MKTKVRIIVVLVIMTSAMVTVGLPLGNQGSGKIRSSEKLKECYTEQEVQLLMEANHYKREQAVELLNLSCAYAITDHE